MWLILTSRNNGNQYTRKILMVINMLVLVNYDGNPWNSPEGNTWLGYWKGQSRSRYQYCIKRSNKESGAASQGHTDRTTLGNVLGNELYSHAETCCDRNGWLLIDYTGKICEISYFNEIPVTRLQTDIHSEWNRQESLFFSDYMIWFDKSLQILLINLNHIRDFSHDAHDVPLKSMFGIKWNDFFIPFDTKESFLHFYSWTPTLWEHRTLQFVLASETQDPTIFLLIPHWITQVKNKKRTIKLMTSGYTRKGISLLLLANDRSIADIY